MSAINNHEVEYVFDPEQVFRDIIRCQDTRRQLLEAVESGNLVLARGLVEWMVKHDCYPGVLEALRLQEMLQKLSTGGEKTEGWRKIYNTLRDARII
jgi:hypothetical protein